MTTAPDHTIPGERLEFFLTVVMFLRAIASHDDLTAGRAPNGYPADPRTQNRFRFSTKRTLAALDRIGGTGPHGGPPLTEFSFPNGSYPVAPETVLRLFCVENRRTIADRTFSIALILPVIFAYPVAECRADDMTERTGFRLFHAIASGELTEAELMETDAERALRRGDPNAWAGLGIPTNRTTDADVPQGG
ncbi:hypothetical protein HY480_04485 [Candidatus Uhrbacteria bacterium]|nr:hypothetical protein [Candidatus Uhrbacteria bacterium]